MERQKPGEGKSTEAMGPDSSKPRVFGVPGPVVSMDLVRYFLRLGWLAFGGPVGQIGLMHAHVVDDEKWLTEEEFLRALNVCHLLPGPEALQLAIYIGCKKGGRVGGVLAGLLFLMPGYLTLSVLGWVYVRFGAAPWLMSLFWGFRPVGFALFAMALWRIAKAVLSGAVPWALALGALFAVLRGHASPIPVLLATGVAHGVWALARRDGGAWGLALGTMAAPAVALPDGPTVVTRMGVLSLFFLKIGLFSFGGAYAALPLMREGAVVTHGWLTDGQMMDALALGETTPGPLIAIGTFVGYLAGQGVGAPWLGATAATFWLFLPSFVFVVGLSPFFERLAGPRADAFLRGVSAGVVGLMASVAVPLVEAAFRREGRWDPLGVALAALAYGVLALGQGRWRVPLVVLAGGILGIVRMSLSRLL